MSRGSWSIFGESISALGGSLRRWELEDFCILICYKMLVSRHLLLSVEYSLPVFTVLK
jgi:hypothetical protein